MMYKKSNLVQVSCHLIMFIMLGFLGYGNVVIYGQECQWVSVDQNSFPQILTMIENQVKQNYDKINTWQGKTKIVSDSIHDGDKGRGYYDGMTDIESLPNKIKQHHEFVREFVLDATEELLYESNYLDGQNYMMDADTGKILPLKEHAGWSSGKYIHTSDYHIDLLNNKNRNGDIVSHTVIKRGLQQFDKQTGGGCLFPVFDPRGTIRIFGDVFKKTLDPLGGAFTRYLNLFEKEHRTDGYPTIMVEECTLANVKKYRIALINLAKDSNGVTVHLFFNLVCSSEVGFNVISYSVTDPDGKVLEEKSFEYGLFNGIYLPTQKIELNFDYYTGNLKEQSTITFFNEKINEPISKEVFTYKNLGLKDGDKFIDKILDKEYTYQDGKLVEVVEKNE